MQSVWFKNTKTKEEKEARKKELLSYRTAFQALNEILEEEESSAPDYDSPSWAFKQADRNGYNRAIRLVRKLIDIKE